MRRNKKGKTINSPLTPPKGAKFTGETVDFGGEAKHVYRELKPVYRRSKLIEVKDPDTGRTAYHPAPAGAVALPRRDRVELLGPEHDEAWREFVLVDLGNGTVKKEFGFREDEEVLARQRKDAARQARIEAILDHLADADPAEVAKMLGNTDALEAVNAAAEKAEASVKGQEIEPLFKKVPREGAPGWFNVVDQGGEAINDNALREKEADRLLESFAAPPPGGDDDDEEEQDEGGGKAADS